MTKKTKQIGYLTAMAVSVGSTIGAGIFFKNGSIFENAHGYLGFMIASWVVAALGVMAIALSLIELASASKQNGVTEFTNKFTKKIVAKFISSYMILVYLPISFLAMAIYAAMALQDTISAGGGPNVGGWGVTGIATLLFLWFIITGYFQKKLAIKSQILFTVIKYLPLIVIIGFAFSQIADNGYVQTSGITPAASGLTSISPWLGIIASIPAILFAYDGFYTVTSLQSDMKDTNMMGLVIVFSLAIITATYLAFGIFTGLAGASDISEITLVKYKSIGTIVNLCILFAVFGIINGFGIGAPEIYYLTYKEHPIGLTVLVKKWFKIKDGDEKTASWILSFILCVFYFILVIPIGIYATGAGNYSSYGSSAGLFTLTDWITNYTSLFIFAFIGAAIFGGLINRRTNKIQVKKSKLFVPSGIIAVVFLTIGGAYMIVDNIVGMTGFGGADAQTEAIKFVLLVITGLVAVVPLLVDAFKKYFTKKSVKKISSK